MQAGHIDELVSAEASARLRAFRRDLTLALPEVIDQLVLFGSRARGDARRESDYDVAVFLRGDLADDLHVRRAVADVAYEHLTDDFFIQTIPMPAHARRMPRTELAMRVAAEGVVIA